MVIMMKNKKILVAILVFASGVVIQSVYFYFYPGIASCNDGNSANYLANSSLTTRCQYTMDVWQDITLYVKIHDSNGRDLIRVPSHVELRDPSNEMIYSKDFDSELVYRFKPSKYGNYTATINALE